MAAPSFAKWRASLTPADRERLKAEAQKIYGYSETELRDAVIKSKMFLSNANTNFPA